jgi:hypothetical protein
MFSPLGVEDYDRDGGGQIRMPRMCHVPHVQIEGKLLLMNPLVAGQEKGVAVSHGGVVQGDCWSGCGGAI